MKIGDNNENQRVQTGIAGLDKVLHGGLTRGSINLIEGASGTGKTTLGLQFALAGLRQEETVLYIAVSETRKDLEFTACSQGWDIGKLQVLELAPAEEPSASMFHPCEVELSRMIDRIKEAVDRIQPGRLVLDSLTELYTMGQDSLHYRRSLFDLRRLFASYGSTVLLLDHPRGGARQHSLVDGIIVLSSEAPYYGSERRKLRIVKLRGRSYLGGLHDFILATGGLQVFPRLVAAEHRTKNKAELLPSGLSELDALLGGGIRTGSSSLLLGSSGSGKSSIAMLFAASAAKRGERALYFTFDERPELILNRAKRLHLGTQAGLEKGLLMLQQVDPAELAPGQFAYLIREQVEKDQVTVVVIDSLNGYLHAMTDERLLITQLHELLSYLGQKGVSAFLILNMRNFGDGWEVPANTSYLTDNVLLFRYFEAAGEIRRAISVLKQRSGPHEQAIRELSFAPEGIKIGEPLRQFQGILSGTPVYTGTIGELEESK